MYASTCQISDRHHRVPGDTWCPPSSWLCSLQRCHLWANAHSTTWHIHRRWQHPLLWGSDLIVQLGVLTSELPSTEYALHHAHQIMMLTLGKFSRRGHLWYQYLYTVGDVWLEGRYIWYDILAFLPAWCSSWLKSSMPHTWLVSCWSLLAIQILTFKNSWRRLPAILDYVNSMLPHMNANDHIGSLRQFNCMCILKNCIFFYKNKYNMICTVRPFAGGHLEYLKFLKDTMVSQICRRPSWISELSQGYQSNFENTRWNEAETVKKH